MKITAGIAISMVCVNIAPTAGVRFQLIPFGILVPYRGARIADGSGGNVYAERIGRSFLTLNYGIKCHRIAIDFFALIAAV